MQQMTIDGRARRTGCHGAGQPEFIEQVEQLEYARARLEKAGLGDRVDLRFCDYRDMEGRYDHIVSIEMIEAVGERYWPDYFAALKRHVAPGGSILVQAIVIADEIAPGRITNPV